MEYYLGIPIQHGLVRSPLRKDRRPTCGFIRSRKGELLFNDLSGDFCGDAVAVVARQQGLTYNQAVQYIAKDQGLVDGTVKPITKKEYPIIDETPAKIDVKLQEWSSDSLKYWSDYGISVETLKTFNVFPLSVIWLNNKVYSLPKKYPVYGYYFGNNEWKIYWPHRKERRFITNTTAIQGMQQLKIYSGCSPDVVVTKSLKDIMVFHELGIPAVAPQGEGQSVPAELFDTLDSMFDNVIVNYDYDHTGIRAMNKIRKEHNVFCLSIKPPEPKDISDFVKKYGMEETRIFVDQVRANVYNGVYHHKHYAK